MKPLLRAIDHIYLSVTDFERSEAFYDGVMAGLGLKKSDSPIAGEAHAHYVSPTFQLSIRPARGTAGFDAYSAGLHHLCFQVEDDAAVDACYEVLAGLNIDATRPARYPEYNPRYYATFFEDPDGIRLEIVGRTPYRDTLADRWEELEGFLNPVTRLPGPGGKEP